jgi:hypothetical protein
MEDLGILGLVSYLIGIPFAFALGTCRPFGYMHVPRLGVRGGFAGVLGICNGGGGYGWSFRVLDWVVWALLAGFFWVVSAFAFALG